MRRRHHALRNLRLPVQQIANDGLAVRGVGQRLANFAPRDQRIIQIESEIIHVGAGAVSDREIALFGENRDHVRREGTDFHVGGTFAQLQRANNGIRHDAHAECGQRRCTAKIAFIAGQDHVVILRLTHKTERAGAHGMLREFWARAGRDDSDSATAQIPKKGCVGYFEVHNYGSGIGGVNARDGGEISALGRALGDIPDVVKRKLHVCGGQA